MTHPYVVHTAFDLLALLLAMSGGWLAYKRYFQEPLAETAARIGKGYFICLTFGGIGGAYLFGTLNLQLSGIPEVGRSILGALFGAIFMVELYKLKNGVQGSTGYVYVVLSAYALSWDGSGACFRDWTTSPTARRHPCPGDGITGMAYPAIRFNSMKAARCSGFSASRS